MFTAGWDPPKLTRRSSSYLSGGVAFLIVAIMFVSMLMEKRNVPVPNIEQGQPLPAYAARAADGSEVTLPTQPGKALLISFWATWCSDCVNQLPSLQAIEDEFGPEGLSLVTVSLDEEEPSWVQAYLEAGGHDWANYFEDPDHVQEIFGWGRRLPKTVLLNRDGTVAVWWRGPLDPTLPQNRDYISGALSSGGSPP